MYRDPFPSIEKAKEICGECKRFLCEELLWQRIYITPDKWGVPFDCPLRTEDEWLIRLELNRLPERTVSDFSGQVWGRHNYVTRYANMENLKAEEIEYILGYVRQNQCIILCKSVFPEYKAWKLFGFWSKCDTIDDPVTAPPFEEQAPASQRREEKTETPLTPTPAKTVPTFELTNNKFRHTDDSIAKERPKAVAEGDTIRLSVATKNIPDDEVVAIKVHNVAGTRARTLTTLEARVKNGLAEAEWVVARDTKQDETELEWDAVYQGVECARGKIEFEKEISGAIAIKITSLFRNPLKDISCEIANEKKSLGTIVTDDQGKAVLNGLPFGPYTLTIKDRDSSIVMPVVWMPDANRPFLIKLK